MRFVPPDRSARGRQPAARSLSQNWLSRCGMTCALPATVCGGACSHTTRSSALANTVEPGSLSATRRPGRPGRPLANAARPCSTAAACTRISAASARSTWRGWRFGPLAGLARRDVGEGALHRRAVQQLERHARLRFADAPRGRHDLRRPVECHRCTGQIAAPFRLLGNELRSCADSIREMLQRVRDAVRRGPIANAQCVQRDQR